ncbi:MAG: hypothetical protein M0D57_17515 [Sphingobacteriales bacterium JAD_PAG50586_3]|nr:MAG: hypothetical protein M0D57_17515 [Sphingobacteriales bacterium JAD_PAG50586_3]
MVDNKIAEAVERLKLDLKGKVVLTEAATGAYAVTPILAALAGAKVYAFTKATRYGSVDEVKKQVYDLAANFKDKNLAIDIIEELTPDIIAQADIITNAGHLRPLTADKLKHAKKGAVLPLMFEAWEWREADLDLNYCKQNGIIVGATNERHPDIDVFSYLGDMALKQIFDAGLCPYKNNFVLVCNNDFGPFIAKVLSKVCSSLAVCDKEENRIAYREIDVEWAGNFPELNITEKYKNAEAVIFTAYPFDQSWIGEGKGTEVISVEKLKAVFNNPFILRYAGDIDEKYCEGKIDFFPKHVSSGHMGVLPSAIGFDPIIRLQAGGLKVGEMLLNGESKFKGLHLLEII